MTLYLGSFGIYGMVLERRAPVDAAELGSVGTVWVGTPLGPPLPWQSKQAWPAHPWLWESLPPWPAWHSNPDKGGLSLSLSLPLCSAAPEAALCTAKANSALQLGSLHADGLWGSLRFFLP